MAKNNFEGEILHFGAVRMRITGSGTFLQYFHTLDNITTDQLPSLTLSATNQREPTTLAMTVSQRACFEGKVTAIDEYFSISRILVFVKSIASGYPQ